MRMLKNILLFQQKIIVTPILIGFLVAITTSIPIKIIAFTLCFFIPFNHYYYYNLQNKNQYFFFYNLGISNKVLWCSTGTITLISFLIFLFS